jgi:hypothetical protein
MHGIHFSRCVCTLFSVIYFSVYVLYIHTYTNISFLYSKLYDIFSYNMSYSTTSSYLLFFVRHLPTWLSGYGGAPDHNICHSISHISSTFWNKPNDDIQNFCRMLVIQRLFSDVLGIFTILISVVVLNQISLVIVTYIMRRISGLYVSGMRYLIWL